jgi:hypothetical protein
MAVFGQVLMWEPLKPSRFADLSNSPTRITLATPPATRRSVSALTVGQTQDRLSGAHLANDAPK